MSQILWNTTVSQLLQSKGQKEFLHLDKLTTLDAALTRLKQDNQRFAAVFDDVNNTATYLGTVDMFDIISFILAFYRKEEVVETRIGVLTIEEWNTDIRTLTKDNEIFKNTTLDYVIELAKKNRKRMLTTSYVPYTVYEGDSLALAIKAFVYEQGLYYLPVVRENKVIAFLAQEDFLPYLLERRAEIFGKDLNKSVEEVFKLAEYGSVDKIVKVSQNDMTIIAFDRLTQEKISALAVVDRDTGRLLANFSATDLMGIVGESITDLRLPVLLFLQKYAQNGFPPISSDNTLTIEQLLHILYSEKVRRIWITNLQKQPVGVLSLSDILNLVYTVLDYQSK